MSGSRWIQPRRWAARRKHQRAPLMTEEGITPDEARIAVMVLAGFDGNICIRIDSYDPDADRYYYTGCDAFSAPEGHAERWLSTGIASPELDKALASLWIPGEHVGNLVAVMRAMAGRGTKQMKKVSELPTYQIGN